MINLLHIAGIAALAAALVGAPIWALVAGARLHRRRTRPEARRAGDPGAGTSSAPAAGGSDPGDPAVLAWMTDGPRFVTRGRRALLPRFGPAARPPGDIH